jgi:hypothetical protein
MTVSNVRRILRKSRPDGAGNTKMNVAKYNGVRAALLIAAAAIAPTNAVASECIYKSAISDETVQFLDRGKVKFVWPHSAAEFCTATFSDEFQGGTIDCKGQEPMDFMLAGLTLDAWADDDLMSLLDTIYYKICSPAKPK